MEKEMLTWLAKFLFTHQKHVYANKSRVKQNVTELLCQLERKTKCLLYNKYNPVKYPIIFTIDLQQIKLQSTIKVQYIKFNK